MNVMLLRNKMDKAYDFNMKQIMHAFERKLNQLINKDKNLINKLPATWVHPLNRKYDCYPV